MAHSLTQAQKPAVSAADLLKLAKMVNIYSIHPSVLALLHKGHLSSSENEHITNAGRTGQTEFLIVELPPTNADLQWSVETLHQVSGKAPPSRARIFGNAVSPGLIEKRYMLVPEPDTIKQLKIFCKDAFRSTEPAAGLGGHSH